MQREQLLSLILVFVLFLIHAISSKPTVNDGLVFSSNVTKIKYSEKTVPCVSEYDPICNHGTCRNNVCVCDDGWITWKESETCSYKQKTKLEAFLVSFFVGALGVDWFVLARGSGGYIAAGVFKLLTGGGLGIWWLVDWIRILANGFHDGNGAPLKPF